ncbi:MAG: DUF1588 domain-containing protein [Gammaproteobacteria bacterium]|nr:DUF1588 domain-containing protein [Gammaproteobacteria bacterium]MDE0271677.1 DUF1588 domain-containing protein [Gammaproteobacteria bacterium]
MPKLWALALLPIVGLAAEGGAADDERARIAYERQRALGHAQMPDTMYASNPSEPSAPHAYSPTHGADGAWKAYAPAERAVSKAADAPAEDLYRDLISPIVQSKCVNCHVEGGVSGQTRLVFAPSSDPDHESVNLRRFDGFLATVENGEQLILSKIRGDSHGGGVQVEANSEEFAQMEQFLDALGGETAVASLTPENLFDTVRPVPQRTTLRRAALILAGRIPTEAEYASIKEIGIRQAIRNLMTGPGFHSFLIRSANDRLLTDRENYVLSSDSDGPLVEYVNEWVRRCEQSGGETYGEAFDLWWRGVQYGARRAPLELIAHVVQNDLPYTEILTADYIMANPWTAPAYGSATAFDNPDDVHEFKPSKYVSHYLRDGSRETEYSDGCGRRIVDPGDLHQEFPHAGILNTKAFLQRYPTTTTNRNRARARWTYYHFLGIDIEKLAARTINPDALADTDNPTLKNPACTACHDTLDPVAGSFQNYAADGDYRANFGGEDSLDDFYKNNRPGGTDHIVEADSWEERERLEATGFFAAGENAVGLAAVRNWSVTGSNVDNITIRDENRRLILRAPAIKLFQGSGCGLDGWPYGWHLSTSCVLDVHVRIPRDGDYTLHLDAWEGYSNVYTPAAVRVWLNQTDIYRQGDTWYRGMLPAGFGSREAPDADNSLQWLAQRVAADPRFARAAVKFWWPAIMGTEVASPPEDPNDADFEAQRVAAEAQAVEVEQLARRFQYGFGTPGRQPYVLKDLLVDITMSKWFRAGSSTDQDPTRTVALRHAGGGRLLTPEELAAKTLALTGFQWGRGKPPMQEYDYDYREPLTRERHELNTSYAILYGGIDSHGVTERARDLTSVMLGVAKRHAAEVSCPIVLREFHLLLDADRKLFSGLDITATPEQSGGEQAIRQTLATLYDRLLGVRTSPRSSEITAAYNFLEEVWNRKRETEASPLLDAIECWTWGDDYFLADIPEGNHDTNPDDPDHIGKTWVVVVAALLMDYRYLHL